MARSTILVIDDEPNILTTVRRSLELEGFAVEVAGGGAAGLAKLVEHDIDLVLLDVMMPGETGLEVLPKLRAAKPETMVVMMSGNATIETAVQATKGGAFDFIEKPLYGDKLLITVQNTLSYARLRYENQRLRGRAQTDFAMIGKGAAMRGIFDKVSKTAPTTGRVLITGENGTGKELVARAIHEHSKRADGPFVKLNCAAIPSELIESELFGHEKGAFTGATASRQGAFELASGGTVFLDELGELSLDLQPKLLRVLEQRELRRVGGTKTIKVDLRVIAATRKDLRSEVEKGKFREDLFFRLNVVPITAPSLRERREDIPLLIDHMLAKLAPESGSPQLSDATRGALMAHDWPGNVRELRNVIERALALGTDPGMLVAPLPPELAGKSVQLRDALEFEAGVSFRESKERWNELFERRYLSWLIKRAEGNISKAARDADMDRKYLHKLLRKYGITAQGGDDDGDN